MIRAIRNFALNYQKKMKVAVEGCCHGELDAIYAHAAKLEKKHRYKVDVLLICGDFQAIRNHRDLHCMAVPQKYKRLGQFYKYYIGEKEAPLLTIVIGGNHEASNYLWELYHGGWLAPSIYFLGHAGCVQVNGVRIAGASGIFNANHFRQGHWETMPYDSGSMRSIYHIREYNIRRLSLLSSPQVFLSHDWPQSIEHYGDLSGLLRRKRFLRQDVETGELGSPPLMGLLRTIQPEWWFSAHLHVRYEATVYRDGRPPPSPSSGTAAPSEPVSIQNPDEIAIDDEDFAEGSMETRSTTTNENLPEIPASSLRPPPRNSDEIVLSDEEEEVIAISPPSVPAALPTTKFLALDKCLPRRDFLEVVDILTPEDFVPTQDNKPTLTYDPEWLAITRAFHPYLSKDRKQPIYPDDEAARGMVEKELEWVKSHVHNNKNESSSQAKVGIRDVADCQAFVMTAPGPGLEGDAIYQQPPWYTNPQTVAFCGMLELENKINPPPVGFRAQSGSEEQ